MVSSSILFGLLAALPVLTTGARVPDAHGHAVRAHAHSHHIRTVHHAPAHSRARRNRRGRRNGHGQCQYDQAQSFAVEEGDGEGDDTEGNSDHTDRPVPDEDTNSEVDNGSGDDSQGQDDQESSETTKEATPTSTDDAAEPSTSIVVSNALAKSPNTGLLDASGPCGASQADENSPNGQEWWLDCGLSSNGWNPPFLTFDQIKTVDLTADGIYAPCEKYFDKFRKAGGTHNIPPIMLAAIAMMESSCDPTLTGGWGEAGMMQLAGVNCDGAPGGDCYNVDFNVNRGAEYLRQMIDANGGSVLLGLGAYNGWSKGMTQATVDEVAAKNGCFAQPNMDYMDQTLNGWLQGKPGYERLTFNNRAKCGPE